MIMSIVFLHNRPLLLSVDHIQFSRLTEVNDVMSDIAFL